MEEICRGFDFCVKQGLCYYWGTSDWTSSEIFEAMMCCTKFGLTMPCCDMPRYNMVERERVECDMTRLIDTYGYGLICCCPTASGLLTGKYNDTSSSITKEVKSCCFPSDPSIYSNYESFFCCEDSRTSKPSTTLKSICDMSKELGCT
jgi:aryl-alcohol dehydrogenase-like predicted oxidoreductase